jgi:LysM repeat protein
LSPIFNVTLSDFPVMVVRRRVHKVLFIKLPTSISSFRTTTSSFRKKSLHTHKSAPHPLRSLFMFGLSCLCVVVPVSVQAGVFQNFIGTDSAVMSQEVEVIKTDSVLDVVVLSAATNPYPRSARGGDDVVAQDGVLISTGPVGRDVISAARTDGGEISVYTVRPGDSLSQIAEMFDVTANTILWANDLPRASAIKPGDTLVILPVAGVRHVVKSGDTIAAIAKKYEGNAEEIISYNQLADAADISAGETLVIPGGALHAAPPVAPSVTKKTTGSKSTVAATANFIHPVPGAIKTQGLHGYNAVDFAAGIGIPVRAAQGGTVIVAKSSGWNGGYGNYVVIKHKNGVQTLYAHLSRVDVGVGASVGQGDGIGTLGNTGKSTGPHLHFEVRGGKNPI